MVGLTRVGRIARDPQAALAFAVEMTEFIKKKYNTESQCWARVGGPTGQIVWQTSFENMAAVQNFNEAILSDEEYWTKVAVAQEKGLFDPSSFEDGLWTQIG